ncbi:DUF4292 domain-containing protein [Soonwooa sp.]|uniref:DUF4292 domain-containing protein n=1 Tax=Soonwooa sp. TaxID=1938592 RepID=UPI0026164219|nr:DUF4292 domain-containing protein [Soonwooa sp.]
MKKLGIIILSAIALSACTARKTITESNTTPISTTEPVKSNKAFFDKILTKSNFEQVKISSKINVENGSFIPTLGATIYIENGQKVWMNLTALFINVARGIATPDGVKGYESYNKTYIDSDFSYLNNLLKVNFIDFNALQNLILGRTFIPTNDKDFELTQNAQGYTLTSKNNIKINVDGVATEYAVKSDYGSDFNLSKVTLNNLSNQDQLEVYYNNWENFEGNSFPKNVKIIIKAKKTDQILIENTKFDFSKMATPYSVPNNYKKTAIK